MDVGGNLSGYLPIDLLAMIYIIFVGDLCKSTLISILS